MIESKTNTRIYLVKGPADDDAALVRASTKNQAIAHVAKSLLTASVATQEQLVDFLGGNVREGNVLEVEDASIRRTKSDVSDDTFQKGEETL